MAKKLSGNEHIDRISDLPDPILGKILSYLPTRNAVATSILSTRWKNLFPFAVPLTRLDLDDSNVSPSFTNFFIDFMDNLFNVSLRDVKCVETVLLNTVHEYTEGEYVSWVFAVMRLKVKYLKLIYQVCYYSKAFFTSLSGCFTLVELEVGDGFELCVPKKFILPNLKRLVLNELELDEEGEELQKLLDGCPVLSELRINACDLVTSEALYIRHPFINKLFIVGSVSEEDCKIVIDAPKLQAFALRGYFVAEYVWMDVKYLHSASLDYEYLPLGLGRRSNSRRLAKLVKSCSNTTRLRLPGQAVEELCLFSSVTLPKFPNLTCLALGRMGTQGWNTLAQFLNNAPNLTMLTFEEELDFVYYLAQAKSPLPSLELHVKKIEVWEFEWTVVEIELIEYFLKNGRQLEELIVHCLPCKNGSDLKKLSSFPRHSKACQVIFKNRTSRAMACYSVESWFQA